MPLRTAQHGGRGDQRVGTVAKCGKHGGDEKGCGASDSVAEAYVNDVKFNSIDHDRAACNDGAMASSILSNVFSTSR